MSMQSYGNFGLKADIDKINENYDLKQHYDNLIEAMEEEDCNGVELTNGECSQKVGELAERYMQLVMIKLEIEIYPIYIDSEAEGTDLGGLLVWMIDFEIREPARQFSTGFETW